MDEKNQKEQIIDFLEKDKSSSNASIKWHCVSNKNNEKCLQNCFTREILALFGKKHTLQIIRLLLDNNQMRFNEILKEIGGSPKTITERLRNLEKHKVILREVFNEIPIRVEYSLTDAGRDLEGIFEQISIWARNWMNF